MKTLAFALLAAALATSPLLAQPAGGETVRLDFEDNALGWVKFGPETARLGITRDEDDVHGGLAALQFNYALAPRQISALALENAAPFARAQTISFWARNSTEATMSFAAQERGGGMWIAIFHLPANKWQKVELSLGDFTTGFGPGDARDPDGKFSPANLEWAGIGDFAQFLLMEPDSPALRLFRIEPAARTLWLDDVAFDPGARVAPVGEAIEIDRFRAPHLSWIPLADTEIAREEREENGAKTPGLSMSYAQATGKFGGVMRRVNGAGWAGATKISMRLASDKAADLALQIEERGGGKYFVPVKAAGDGQIKELSFNLAQFQPADDSRDDNGRLDIEQASQVLLLDLAFLNPAAPAGENTIWIGEMTASK